MSEGRDGAKAERQADVVIFPGTSVACHAAPGPAGPGARLPTGAKRSAFQLWIMPQGTDGMTDFAAQTSFAIRDGCPHKFRRRPVGAADWRMMRPMRMFWLRRNGRPEQAEGVGHEL
jgi:hypothetical protein